MRKGEDRNSPSVSVGFPNAALDSADLTQDLNKLVVKNPISTFYMKIESDTYDEYGFNRGDIAVIDRSLQAKKSDYVVVGVDGDFFIKKLKDILGAEVELWGVITYVIKRAQQ